MRILHPQFLFAAIFVGIVIVVPLVSASSPKERKALVVIEMNLKAPAEAKNVRLWIPYPMSDKNQDVTDVIINGNYSFLGVYRDPQFGNNDLYADWNGPVRERKLSFSFKVNRKELVPKNFPQKEAPFSPDEFKEYLWPTSLGQTEGRVKEYALKITKGKKTVLAKARAVYDWIVDNMHRDPNVKGCGFGEVENLLQTLGGKCADIHSVFVALARAAGVPAREVFGIRIPKGQEGDMTKAQHCWAEFYLPGHGWAVVDPADVRKMILEQNLSLDQAKPYREYYFGAVDESRIAFGTGRDVVLNPPQSAGTLNYFMYPYAEVDGKPLNEDLYGFNIGYTISFKELSLSPAASDAEFKVITTEQLKEMLDKKKEKEFMLIDARTKEEYQEAHIPGAISMPEKNFEDSRSLLPADKNFQLVFYCNGAKCGKSKKAATKAGALGYTNILIYDGGFPVWEEKGLKITAGPDYAKKIETSKLTPAELKKLIDSGGNDYVLVDVRDEAEFKEGHIPTAVNIPVETFASHSGVLPKEKKIIVYCNSGGRGYNAFRKLMKLAYPSIYQTFFADWKEAAFPVEKF